MKKSDLWIRPHPANQLCGTYVGRTSQDRLEKPSDIKGAARDSMPGTVQEPDSLATAADEKSAETGVGTSGSAPASSTDAVGGLVRRR